MDDIPAGYPYSITLIKKDSETWEDYQQRWLQVVLSAQGGWVPGTSHIDFSDTMRFRKIGDTAYEAITTSRYPEDEEVQESE